jgi:hypothetical protein
MTEHEITSGVGANTFGPGLPNSRAGLATFLHRFADEPGTTLPTPFVDVDAGAYYEHAVGWAADEEITSGVLPELFVPHGIITRAQAAVMLWRFAGGPAPSAPNPFDDVPDDAYYALAVRWMVEWGITTGTTDTTFAPADTLTRGQIATFLWRLAGEPDAFATGSTLPSAMRAS